LQTKRKNIIILGTGFAAFSCLKKINYRYYNVSVVSPQNHFLFTPLLPSTTVGTIEFRSIIEPIRKLKNIHYYQAKCTGIDLPNRSIQCTDLNTSNNFTLNYDILVLAVGEITNTFNIEGVNDYAYFLKEVSDARKIRVRVIDCFENASIPVMKLNSYIVKVTKEHIYVNDGSKFEYGLLVWATGNTAIELIHELPFKKTKRNKILVDSYFKVLDYDNIYALGDCAELENKALPVTAQVAQQQGKYLGKVLNRLAKEEKITPFRFHDLGMLAYIGDQKALADLPQYKGTGFKAFLFWRSVYITKLVSLKNKILVLFDWFKNMVFGRDISNF
jgi:NADH:ubiquinone reductase (non-electrogenic)